jgi:hypothetical protein
LTNQWGDELIYEITVAEKFNPMKVSKILVVVCALFGLAASLSAYGENPNSISDDVMPEARTDITLQGYFKDSARNRIWTFAYAPGTEVFTIKNHAHQLLKTEGRVSEVYYYPAGSVIPGDELTYARNLRGAHFLLYDTDGPSSWHYAYRLDEKNRETFVDCETDKISDYCRDNNVIK